MYGCRCVFPGCRFRCFTLFEHWKHIVRVSSRFTIFFGNGVMVFSVLGRQRWCQGGKLCLHVKTITLFCVRVLFLACGRPPLKHAKASSLHHISSTYTSSQVTTITTSSGCYCHLSRISTRLQELTTPTHCMSQRGSLRLRICLL
jgi:hypothetical protein